MITLYRVVDAFEQATVETTHQFLPSPNGTEYKGFFFSQRSAEKFAARESIIRRDDLFILSAFAPELLVSVSPQHRAADKGSGVLIRNEDLWQVQPHEPAP